jgi:hypothetical protein
VNFNKSECVEECEDKKTPEGGYCITSSECDNFKDETSCEDSNYNCIWSESGNVCIPFIQCNDRLPEVGETNNTCGEECYQPCNNTKNCSNYCQEICNDIISDGFCYEIGKAGIYYVSDSGGDTNLINCRSENVKCSNLTAVINGFNESYVNFTIIHIYNSLVLFPVTLSQPTTINIIGDSAHFNFSFNNYSESESIFFINNSDIHIILNKVCYIMKFIFIIIIIIIIIIIFYFIFCYIYFVFTLILRLI